ncbi:hypothetical protein F5Y09DRAFT_266259 [Xylaria sp. FL1042]|nr:hypothetical protein F5Y09DRAFT_266259 [Xylaria sp. FL1042]
MAGTVKTRQPRLRASCDGCFLAKVKCSKTRPVCSRCLACGLLCNYSPSSRSGKPKPDNHGAHSNPPHNQPMRALMDNKSMEAFMQMTHDNNMYPLQTSWPTPPTSTVEDTMSRNPSITSGFPLLGVNESTMNEQGPMSAPPELYSGIPWDPSTDIAGTTFSEMSIPATHMQGPHGRSHSFDATMRMTTPIGIPMAWGGPTSHEMFPYSQVQTPTTIAPNYFPSPATTPMVQPIQSYQQSGGQCVCFVACLQSLMNLHNMSINTQPNLRAVIHFNQKAIDGCSTMLACSICLSKPHVDTTPILLATIIGKIASVYKSTVELYSESGTMPMLEGQLGDNIGDISLGTYQQSGGAKWANMNLLVFELHKLQDLFARFRDVCKDVPVDEPDMLKAVISYAGQNIDSIVGAVDHRINNTTFAVA